jgi:CRP/FNR family cyclic AMP-dependent transcriptional regulator
MENLQVGISLGGYGRQRLIDALRSQAMIHDEDIAIALARRVKVEEVGPGTILIRQGASDTDLYFILSGEFSIMVNGRVVAQKTAGEQVGEMAVVDPIRCRFASVIAESDSTVAKISESDFTAVADKYPRLWRRIAMELANRLRNESVHHAGENPGKAA